MVQSSSENDSVSQAKKADAGVVFRGDLRPAATKKPTEVDLDAGASFSEDDCTN
jgi:hypothetical protein